MKAVNLITMNKHNIHSRYWYANIINILVTKMKGDANVLLKR